MNTKSNIFIDIITSFKGTAQLKQAESAFEKLTGTVKSFAAAYTVEKVIADSIAAFKAESSAISGLNVALQNTGTTFDALSPILEKQAENMTNLGFKTSDTYDALARLTTSTHNPAKALQILGTAADLARYHGTSLADTATVISKVLAGNGKALTDLGLKYDKTLTPVNALDKLMKQAKERVGGVAQAYSKTLGGALDVAAAKADRSKAKLGAALAPTITKLADFATKFLAPVFDFLSSHIEEVTAMAAAILAVAAAIKLVGINAKIAAGEMAFNPLFAAAAVGAFAVSRIIKSKSFAPTNASNPSSGIDLQHSGLTPGATSEAVNNIKKISDAKVTATKKELTAAQILAAYLAKSDKQAIADQKALNDQKAKQFKLDQASALLRKSQSIFDQQAIEIAAAQKNASLTADEKLRLSMMATQDQLQAAIQDQNLPAVDKLVSSLQTLQATFEKMAVTNAFQASTQGAIQLQSSIYGLNAALQATRGTNPLGGSYDLSNYASIPLAGSGTAATTVNVTVQGSVISSGDLVSAVQQGIVNNTAGGSPSNYARNLGAPLRDSW